MSTNPSLRQPMGPLSIGNVVSSALILYRSHLTSYFRIALLATLWVLLPILVIVPVSVLFATRVLDALVLWLVIPIWLVLFIYCLAQSLMNTALISRLGFSELVGQPESVSAARTEIKVRLWSFLLLALLAWLLLVVVSVPLVIIASIIGGILGFILALVTPLLGTIVSVLIVFAILLGGISWLYARLLSAEVELAVENESKVLKSIQRSWDLSQNSAFRLLVVVLVAFLVTLPIVFLTGYLPSIALLSVEEGSVTYWVLYVISLVISLVGGAVVTPFWQTLKAVVYYDLRSRREGLGLRMRDSMS